MRRLHILCEGQTEETVARDVITPYFMGHDTCVTWSILATKRPAGGPAHKGGLSSWGKIEREICRLLTDSSITVLTTLFDYYGLPIDVPGMAGRPRGAADERVAHVEKVVAKHIGNRRFLPHLVLHELEAWVLVGHQALGELTGRTDLATAVRRIVDLAGGAELVNRGGEGVAAS